MKNKNAGVRSQKSGVRRKSLILTPVSCLLTPFFIVFCLLTPSLYAQRTRIASPTQNPPYDPAFAQIAIQSATGQTGNIEEWAKTVKQNIGTGDGITVTFTPSLTSTPVAKTSVVVTIAAESIQATDNGYGLLLGRGLKSGTINYTSGAVSLTFLNPPLLGDVIAASYGQNVCYVDAAVIWHGNCGSGFLSAVNWFHNNTALGVEPGGDFADGSHINLAATDDAGASRVHYTFNWTGVDWLANGTAVATEPGGNFIQGSGVTITAVDNAGANRVDYTISATGGAASCPDIAQVTDWYVATTGNDSTGDGSSGNPWLTIQHAIDAGVPGIVCGRYIIHLAAGTYVGKVILQGRIFAGGGTALNGAFPDNPEDSFWPISGDPGDKTDNTWPYSWVEIVGSSAAPETYIIQPVAGVNVSNQNGISMSHANLTLRGVQVQLSALGVNASQKSLLNVVADIFTNNFVGIMATEESTVHVDPSGYVDDAGFDTVLFTNTNPGGGNFTGTDAIEIADRSLLTDYDSTGNNVDTHAVVHYQKGLGSLSIGCIELKNSFIYYRGTLECEVSGIVARQSYIAVMEYDFDGLAPNTGTAIILSDSQMAPAADSGGVYSITNASIAVHLIGASSITPYPTITSATKIFTSNGNTLPNDARSNDTFFALGTLVDTVPFSATPTFDMTLNGSTKKITLTGDVTSSTITNPVPGEEITFEICQDGGGSHLFAFPTNVKGAGTIAATLSTCNVQRFFWDQGASLWYALAPMVTGQ